MIKIAVYGKGGIGKSTAASNVSVALAQKGLKVMQIGCDPKADSTIFLHGGERIPTVLDLVRKGESFDLEDMVRVGYNGVVCVEAGGPVPGLGCAGRGIIATFQLLEDLKLFETWKPDVGALRCSWGCSMRRFCGTDPGGLCGKKYSLLHPERKWHSMQPIIFPALCGILRIEAMRGSSGSC